MLPERTPRAIDPPAEPITIAPPEIIRRLLVALAQWEPKRQAS